MAKSKNKRYEAYFEAEAELRKLRDGLSTAYSVFNNSSDPALVEASILEISALQGRYSVMLRNLKSMSGES